MNDARRNVIIGRNSAVWSGLAGDTRLEHCVAIGHADISGFPFRPSDRVWILSYSRSLTENRDLLDRLATAGAVDYIYVSTATANVDAITGCYGYPRIKRACELMSQSVLNARILTIGVVYRSVRDLPGGITMATSFDQLAAFMVAPDFSKGTTVNLFKPIDRPFTSNAERIAFSTYGAIQRLASTRPCLLRPLDFVLRALGWRWYGYLYLSNRLWHTTTS